MQQALKLVRAANRRAASSKARRAAIALRLYRAAIAKALQGLKSSEFAASSIEGSTEHRPRELNWQQSSRGQLERSTWQRAGRPVRSASSRAPQGNKLQTATRRQARKLDCKADPHLASQLVTEDKHVCEGVYKRTLEAHACTRANTHAQTRMHIWLYRTIIALGVEAHE